MRVETENLLIDPELCKRLDRAIYGSTPPAQSVIDRANVYRTELVNAIRKYSAEVADKEGDRCLYRLYTILERLILDESAHNTERRQANIQTARTQLKAWK